MKSNNFSFVCYRCCSSFENVLFSWSLRVIFENQQRTLWVKLNYEVRYRCETWYTTKVTMILMSSKNTINICAFDVRCASPTTKFQWITLFFYSCNHLACCEFRQHCYDFLIYTFPWNLSQCIFSDVRGAIQRSDASHTCTLILDYLIFIQALDWGTLCITLAIIRFLTKLRTKQVYPCQRFQSSITSAVSIFFIIIFIPFATRNNFNFIFLFFNFHFQIDSILRTRVTIDKFHIWQSAFDVVNQKISC